MSHERTTVGHASSFAFACGSSEGNAIGDDALKDQHVAGWLSELDGTERDRWVERFGWVRRIDRLAEASFDDVRDTGFDRFLDGWAKVRAGIGIHATHPSYSLLVSMSRAPSSAKHALNRYIEATRLHHGHDLSVATIAQHQHMLEELSGSILLAMPNAPSSELHDEIVALGAVDQLYNDVRDVIEDVSAGTCRFPSELLARSQISREHFLASDFECAGVRATFRFLVDELGPQIRSRCAALRSARAISPTWQRLVLEFDRRHDRLEQVVRASGFHAPTFTMKYWQISN